jgi:hypothetical protein
LHALYFSAVGKSAFDNYLIWQAVKDKRTVVYVSDKVAGVLILYSTGRVRVMAKSAFEDTLPELDDANAVLIYDGKGEGKETPPIVRATTVVVTSPQSHRYKEFSKTGAIELCFPVFYRAEIEDMLTSCYPWLDNEAEKPGVWTRYYKWGGIPRYVLGIINKSQQAKLEAAVTKIDLDQIANVLDKPLIEDTIVPHRLFHLQPAGATEEGFVNSTSVDSYEVTATVLGSYYIKRLVLYAMKHHFSLSLSRLLGAPILSKSVAKFL